MQIDPGSLNDGIINLPVKQGHMQKILQLTFLFLVIPLISTAQSIDSVTLTEIGRYQHGYVSFPDSFSAPTLSSRIDRLGRPYIFMACSDSGLMVLDISDPGSPLVVDRKYPNVFGGLKVMNLEQYDDLLYLALGDFNGTGQSPGLAILDVTDPSEPLILDTYAHAPFTHGSAIVKVHEGYAYLGAMEEGIVVLDINDLENIAFHSSFLPPDPTWPNIANYPANARGMTISGDMLYLAFDAGALRAINISDPGALTEVGRHLNPSHPILTNPAYNNVLVLNDRLYATIDYCGMEIVDISDPENMTQVNWLNPWNCSGFNWFGSDGHDNELIIALGDSLLFVSGADSEIMVYDITDPDEPVLKGGHILPNDSASTWGVDLFGDLVVGSFINNHGLPLQPYDSKYGGVVLFNWEADISTGLREDPISNELLTVFPNPTDGIFTIRMPQGHYGNRDLVITDITGRPVHKAPIRNDGLGNKVTVDLSGHDVGLYMVVCTLGDQRIVQRLVLEH